MQAHSFTLSMYIDYRGDKILKQSLQWKKWKIMVDNETISRVFIVKINYKYYDNKGISTELHAHFVSFLGVIKCTALTIYTYLHVCKN